MKMVKETKKILGDASVAVTATTVRVPVFRCHSESLNIETAKKITANEVRAVLSTAPGIIVYDAPEKNIYPLAIDVADKDEGSGKTILLKMASICGLFLIISEKVPH
jgi:aspartate-semialdehyde dehydrogenase